MESAENHFEPSVDAIYSVIEKDDEYNVDLSERLLGKPVFDSARRLQIDFRQNRITREELHAVWNEVQQYINVLDEQATEQGVMGERVTLVGEGIRRPQLERDFATDIALVSLWKETNERSGHYERSIISEHQGRFAGFAVRFEQDAQAINETFIPILVYQVSAGSTYTPNAFLRLFTTGDVGLTQLSFEKDERRDEMQRVTKSLFEEFSDHGERINRINVSLLSAKEDDASCLRHVGYHAAKMINSIKDEQKRARAEDLLADLIRLYIEPSATYTMEVRSHRTSVREKTENDEGQQDTLWQAQNGNTYTLESQPMDIVFMNRTIPKDGKIAQLDQRIPYLVLAGVDNQGYVSLFDIEAYVKQ